MSADYSRHTDQQLLEAFRQSDKEKDAVFRELFSRYERKVYVYCLRISGNPDDAADVFQETFMRFYNQSRRDAPIQNFLAYLLTSARNIFLNLKRSAVHWSPFDEERVAAQAPLYEREEMMNLISSALTLLDDPYREAFIMRFYEGLSYNEISEITGDSVSSLKVRVMRAKEQLKTILLPYINDMQ
jgi:RNA polymerase sigma-70 factor, ECF subfamily